MANITRGKNVLGFSVKLVLFAELFAQEYDFVDATGEFYADLSRVVIGDEDVAVNVV